MTFRPDRLTDARLMKGLTKKQLADGIVTPGAISHYEGGVSVPGDDVVAKLAAKLGVAPRFFLALEPLPRNGPCFYRKKSRTPKYVREAYEARARFIGACGELVGAPVSNLPDWDTSSVQAAAAALRAHHGFQDDEPIPSVVDLLERHAIWVHALDAEADDLVDAFCTEVDGRALVFLNSDRDPYRRRLNAAHELFHLLSGEEPASGRAEIRKQESEATAFGSELLLPGHVWADLAPRRGLTNPWAYVKFKAEFGISVKALMYKTHEAGLTTDSQYRYGMMRYGQLGWSSGEHDEGGHATDEARLPAAYLAAAGLTVADVSHELGCSSELAASVFDLPAPSTPRPTGPRLRVIEGGR